MASRNKLPNSSSVRCLQPENPAPSAGVGTSTPLSDTCAYVFHCGLHNKVALATYPYSMASDSAMANNANNVPNGATTNNSNANNNNMMVWLPFVLLSGNTSWQEAAKKGAIPILAATQVQTNSDDITNTSGVFGRLVDQYRARPPFTECSILEVFRVQQPHTLAFLTRVVFYVRLDSSRESYFACCQSRGHIRWEALSTLTTGQLDNVFGPEVMRFAKWLTRPSPQPPLQRITEFDMRTVFKYHRVGAAKAQSTNTTNMVINLQQELLRAAGLTERDVELVYLDFVHHCFPAWGMSYWSFRAYLNQYGYQLLDNKVVRLFRAFNYQLRSGYLNFHELLLGLASIDPNTEHTEPRVRFVFAYYNRSNNNGQMNREEYTRMVRDMMRSNSPEQVFLEKERELTTALGLGQNNKDTFSVDEFVDAVQGGRFRGTSALCRTALSIFPMISRAFVARELRLQQSQTRLFNLNAIVSRKSYVGQCARCKEDKRYRLVPYTAKVNRNFDWVKHEPTLMLKCLPNAKQQQQISIPLEPFLQRDHYAVALMKRLHDFNPGDCYQPNGLLQDSPELLVMLLERLVCDLNPQLNTLYGRYVPVSSPCFVIGDIHGNLADLLSMERALWPSLPLGANLLFLGDYVDRGRWSVECSLYVFALKVLHPGKVTLLRGNHEVRLIQEKYSFVRECLQKYGEELGMQMVDLFNYVFQRLPIAASVDETIYCAHGGIPHVSGDVRDIAQLPIPIVDIESELFWEIVWSDPITSRQYEQVCLLFQLDPDRQGGFVRNTKRGAAWYFNQEAASHYLHSNGLTHMIRAHEVPHNGFTFHFQNAICATVFSSSHYSRGNRCAVMLVCGQRIRPILVDTEANLMPFDEMHMG